MNIHLKKSPAIFLIFSLIFFLVSCTEKTDRDLILDLVDDVSKFAEKKDLAGIMTTLAEDYSDFEGRGKKETEYMINDYFKRYKGIVIYLLSTRIDEINTPEASIQTEAALSSGAAKVFRKFVKFSTEYYRLNIKLIKTNDTWKVKQATWRYVSLEDLYPESLSIFNKIFNID